MTGLLSPAAFWAATETGVPGGNLSPDNVLVIGCAGSEWITSRPSRRRCCPAPRPAVNRYATTGLPPSGVAGVICTVVPDEPLETETRVGAGGELSFLFRDGVTLQVGGDGRLEPIRLAAATEKVTPRPFSRPSKTT